MKSGLEGKLSSLWTIRYWSVGKGAVTASRTPRVQEQPDGPPTGCSRPPAPETIRLRLETLLLKEGVLSEVHSMMQAS